jgi:hypothetical protein
MSRFNRRIWGSVLAVVAAHFAYQAVTFRIHHFRPFERAFAAWYESGAPEAKAAMDTALVERRRREQPFRVTLGAVSAMSLIGAGWLLLRKPQHPDFVSLRDVGL